MFSLPTCLMSLGLKIFTKTTENECKNSTRITSNLQSQSLGTNNSKGKTRSEIKAEREKRNQETLRQFLATLDEKKKRMVESLNQKGVSNLLTNLPIKELENELTKQKFWGAIKIRYNWPLDRVPYQCICGASFDVRHALSCKKGGFITLRHIEVPNITSELLVEVCVDVRKEPILQEVNNEDLPQKAKKRNYRLKFQCLRIQF